MKAKRYKLTWNGLEEVMAKFKFIILEQLLLLLLVMLFLLWWMMFMLPGLIDRSSSGLSITLAKAEPANWAKCKSCTAESFKACGRRVGIWFIWNKLAVKECGSLAIEWLLLLSNCEVTFIVEFEEAPLANESLLCFFILAFNGKIWLWRLQCVIRDSRSLYTLLHDIQIQSMPHVFEW